MKEELLLQYAFSFIGKEYLYGGNGPYFDCSGLVIELLKASGKPPPHDMSAQQLFEYLKPKSRWEFAAFGSVAFYGRAINAITHTAWCLDSETILEAGGGDNEITTKEIAQEKSAFIRIRPLRARKDLVCTLFPY